MKHGIVISACLFIIGMVILLLQLWFQFWSADMLFKILATLVALFLISLVVAFVGKEIRDTRRLHHDDE